MCSVLNSTSHNRECSEGLTVNGLQVITPPHNMYCTGTQESGTSATQTNDDTRMHIRTHTHTHHTTHAQHTHTHTHTHTNNTHTHVHAQSQKLTLLYCEGEHPMHYGHNRPQSSSPVDPKQLPALWLQPPLPKSKCGLQIEEKIGCSISDTRRGLKCPVPIPRRKDLSSSQTAHACTLRFIYAQLTVECTMNEGSGLVRSTTSSPTTK